MNNSTKITFKEDGSPYSTQFDDIYFDTNSGYGQSYAVFIQANNIANRLLHSTTTFAIAETGFGTGLNFLLTLKTYLHVFNKKIIEKSSDKIPSLHFISVEKYPLTKTELIQSLSILPELSALTQDLVAQYPEQVFDDIQCTFLNGNVTLTLLVGDATEKFRQYSQQQIENSGKHPSKFNGVIDAWFLDGFTPARNPDMWHLPLFEYIAVLSKPQSTFSTFTVAGVVRRNLINVGFRVEKQTAIGVKEQCLTGVFQQLSRIKKGYQKRPVIGKPQTIAIIGGGIAAACAAYKLTKKGIKVVLYCQDTQVAQGASSNAIGALYPLLHQQRDEISAFYETAFWHAKAFYQELLDEGFHFSHDWCGLLDIAYKPALELRHQSFAQLNTWPSDLITYINSDKASEVAGIPLKHGGLFMPNAGWICPPELVQQLFIAADKTGRLRINTQVKIKTLSQTDELKWQLNGDNLKQIVDVLLVCGGADSIKLNIIDELPLTSVRGQVTSVQTTEQLKNLATVICHKGYLTPSNQSVHCIGATFTKNSFDVEPKHEDDLFNKLMLEKCLPELVDLQKPNIVSSKARLRCMTPDHLPLVGAMPNIERHKNTYRHLAKDKHWHYSDEAPCLSNLYVLTGLGARGLCTAPLLADIITADLAGTPYPVDDDMLFNLSPNRFIIRDIIRRKFE